MSLRPNRINQRFHPITLRQAPDANPLCTQLTVPILGHVHIILTDIQSCYRDSQLMHWIPAKHCMGCFEDPRWPNVPQLEEAIRPGRSAECVEMIIHAAYAYARSFQRSTVISDISQASERKFPSFLGLVLLWQVSDIVLIEDQAGARLYKSRVLPSEIITEAGKAEIVYLRRGS